MSIAFPTEWSLYVHSDECLRFGPTIYTYDQLATLLKATISIDQHVLMLSSPTTFHWRTVDHTNAHLLFNADDQYIHDGEYYSIQCTHIVFSSHERTIGVDDNVETVFDLVRITKPVLSFDETDAITRQYVDMKVAEIVGGSIPYTMYELAETIRATKRLLSTAIRF